MEKISSIVSEICVSYDAHFTNNPIIVRSVDAFEVLLQYFPAETLGLQERFVALYLNRINKVIGVYPVSIGGITSTIADIRLVFGVALKTAATSIMIAHNHPSGSVKPSQQDIQLTERIKEARKIMDVRLLDHFILSPDRKSFFSFADEGLL